MRHISAKGISLIKSFEGCRLQAYLCPSKVWTIGYGHTEGVKKGDTITQEKAEELLKEDLVKYEKHVLAYDDLYDFTQGEFDALVSFTYNCGAGNLRKLLDYGRRNRAEIRKAFPLYNKSNGVPLKGLTRRRKAELELFNSDTHPAEVEPVSKFYPQYKGKSTNLDVMLKEIGADKDFSNETSWRKRIPIAKANGIQNYKGSLTQNVKLKNLAKNGKLERV